MSEQQVSNRVTSPLKRFVLRFKNAKTVIEQLKAGEWEFIYNIGAKDFCTAHREGVKMWVTNGPFFCEIEDTGINAFGYFWRHYVYWLALREAKKKAIKKYKNTHIDEMPIL